MPSVRFAFPLLLVVAGVIAGMASAFAATPPDPAALLAEIAAAKLDPARAVSLSRVKLDIGLASLVFDQGTLFPVSAVGGETVELVFEGKGHVRLQPPDAIETGQLELFTGQGRLDQEFKEAVLVVGRDAVVQALLGKPHAASDPGLAAKADALYSEWKKKPERKFLDVETAILLDALQEAGASGYFLALFRGGGLGDFLLSIDPVEREQVTLGRFVPIEATDRERRKILKELGREQRKGRLLGLELEDLGQWDTWLSAPLSGADGKPVPGGASFEPKKYTLDTTIAKDDLRLQGKARIDLETMLPGARAVALRLNRDLKVTKVSDGAGQPLFFRQNGGGVTALLPAPATAVESPVVVVEYEGRLIEKDFNLYRLTDTETWYPHAGEIDRALCDATFHWPRNLDLVTGGRRVGGGESGGYAWEHRTVELRSFGCSFEIGHFRRDRLQAGHVEIDFAFGSGSALTGKGTREEVMKTVADALDYYEKTFGPYPLDYLTVATANRGFSQGLLGFVTLSDALLNDLGMWNRFFGIEDRRAVIAHELAHQWWGNEVGWASYRDQWISEAMASYSALLYTKERLGDKLSGAGITAGWQEAVSSPLPDGRPLESVGPVVLGARLSSSLAQWAYQPIVYQKGAVVLNMLALTLGQENFPRMLKEIVKAAAGNVISTADLVALLEKVSATKLDAFAGQYIFGTGLPEVQFDYRFEAKPGGGWLVKGSARQLPSYVFRYRLERDDKGALDVRREGVPRVDVSRSLMVVPLEIETFDPKQGKGKGWLGANGAIHGNLAVRGEVTPFDIPVDLEPKRVWLDPKGRVYGSFLNAARFPGNALLAQGVAAAAGGRAAEAEALFQKAKAAPEPSLEGEKNLDWRAPKWIKKALHAQVDLARARLLVDQHQDAEAETALAAAERGGADTPSEVEVLRARIEIHRGDYDRAFRRLKKGLLSDNGFSSVEGYALLAVAAKATHHDEELQKAKKRARDWGVDLRPLEATPAPGS
jgi:hypothetical protein